MFWSRSSWTVVVVVVGVLGIASCHLFSPVAPCESDADCSFAETCDVALHVCSVPSEGEGEEGEGEEGEVEEGEGEEGEGEGEEGEGEEGEGEGEEGEEGEGEGEEGEGEAGEGEGEEG